MDIQTFKQAFLEKLGDLQQARILEKFGDSPARKSNKSVLSKEERQWYKELIEEVGTAQSIPAALDVLRSFWLGSKKSPSLSALILTALQAMKDSIVGGESHPSHAVGVLLKAFVVNPYCFNPAIVECFFKNLTIELSPDNVAIVQNILCADTEECFANNIKLLRADFAEKDQHLINQALTACSQLPAVQRIEKGKAKAKTSLGTRLLALCEKPVTVPSLPLSVLPTRQTDQQPEPIVSQTEGLDPQEIARTMKHLVAVPLSSHPPANLSPQQTRLALNERRTLSKTRQYSQILSTNDFLLSIMDNYCSDAQVLVATVDSNAKRKDRASIKAARVSRCRHLCEELGDLPGMPRSMSEDAGVCRDESLLQQEEELWQLLSAMLRELHALYKKPSNTPLAACSVMDLQTLSALHYNVTVKAEANSPYGRYLAQAWLAKLAKHKGSVEHYDVSTVAGVLQRSAPKLRSFIPQYAGCTIVSTPTVAAYEAAHPGEVPQRVVLFDSSTKRVHYYDQNARHTVYDPQDFGVSARVEQLLSTTELTVWTDELFCKRFKKELPNLLRGLTESLRDELGLKTTVVYDNVEAARNAIGNDLDALIPMLTQVFSTIKTRQGLLKQVDVMAALSTFSTEPRQQFCNQLRALVDFDPLYDLGIAGAEDVDVLSLVDRAEAIDQKVDDFDAVSRYHVMDAPQNPLEATVYYVLTYGDSQQKQKLFQLLQSESAMQNYALQGVTFVPNSLSSANLTPFDAAGLDVSAQVWFSILCLRLERWTATINEASLAEPQAQQILRGVLQLKQSKLWQALSVNQDGEGKILRDRQCAHLKTLLHELTQKIVAFNDKLEVPMQGMPELKGSARQVSSPDRLLRGLFSSPTLRQRSFSDLFVSAACIEPISAKLQDWQKRYDFKRKDIHDALYKVFKGKLQSDLSRVGDDSLASALAKSVPFSVDNFLDTYAPLELQPIFESFNSEQKKNYTAQLTLAAKTCVAAIITLRQGRGDWYTDYNKLIARLGPFGVNPTELQAELLKQLQKQPQILKALRADDTQDGFTQHVRACINSLGAWPSSAVAQNRYTEILSSLLDNIVAVFHQKNWLTPDVFEDFKEHFRVPSLPATIQQALYAKITDHEKNFEQQVLIEEDNGRRSQDEMKFSTFLVGFHTAVVNYKRDREGRSGSIFNNTKAKRLDDVKVLLVDIEALQKSYSAIKDLDSFQQYQRDLKKLTADLEKIISVIEKSEWLKEKNGRKVGSQLFTLCESKLKELKRKTTVALWRGLQKAEVDIPQVVLDQGALDNIVVRRKPMADVNDERYGLADIAVNSPMHEDVSDAQSVMSDVTLARDDDFIHICSIFAPASALVQQQNAVRASLLACQQSLLDYQHKFSKDRWTRFWVAKDRKNTFQRLLESTDSLLMRLDYTAQTPEELVSITKDLNQFWSDVQSSYETIARDDPKGKSRLGQALRPYATSPSLEVLQKEVEGLSDQYKGRMLQTIFVGGKFTGSMVGSRLDGKIYLEAMAGALSSIVTTGHTKEILDKRHAYRYADGDCQHLYALFTAIQARLIDKFGNSIAEAVQQDSHFKEIQSHCDRIGVAWAKMSLSLEGFNYAAAVGGLAFPRRLTWPLWFAGFESATFEGGSEYINKLMELLGLKGSPRAEAFSSNETAVFYDGHDISHFKRLLDEHLHDIVVNDKASMFTHPLAHLYLDIHSHTLEDYVGEQALGHLDILFGFFARVPVDGQYPTTIERLLLRVLDIVAQPNMDQQVLDIVVEKLVSVMALTHVQTVLTNAPGVGILPADKKQFLAKLRPSFDIDMQEPAQLQPEVRTAVLAAANQQHNLPLIEFGYKDLRQALSADNVLQVSQAYAKADANWQLQLKWTLLGYIEQVEACLQGDQAAAHFESKNIYYLAWLTLALREANPDDKDFQTLHQRIEADLQPCLADAACPKTLRNLLVHDADADSPATRWARTLLVAEKTMAMLALASPRVSIERDSTGTLSDLTATDRDAQSVTDMVPLNLSQAGPPLLASIKSASDPILHCFAQDRFDQMFEGSPRHEVLHALASLSDLSISVSCEREMVAFQKQSLSHRYVLQCFAWLDKLAIYKQIADAGLISQIQHCRQMYFANSKNPNTVTATVDSLFDYIAALDEGALGHDEVAKLAYFKQALEYVSVLPSGVNPSPVGLPLEMSEGSIATGCTDGDDSLLNPRELSLEAMVAQWLAETGIQAASLKEAVLLLWYRSKNTAEGLSVDTQQLVAIYDQLLFLISELNRQNSVLAPLLSRYDFQQRLLECLAYLGSQLPEESTGCKALIDQVRVFSQPKLATFNTEFQQLHEDWKALNEYARKLEIKTAAKGAKIPADLALKADLLKELYDLFLPFFGGAQQAPTVENELGIAVHIDQLQAKKAQFLEIHQQLKEGLTALDKKLVLSRSLLKGTCAKDFEKFKAQLDRVITIGMTPSSSNLKQASPPRLKSMSSRFSLTSGASPPGSAKKSYYRSSSRVDDFGDSRHRSSSNGTPLNSSFTSRLSFDSIDGSN